MSKTGSDHGDEGEMAATHWEFDVDEADPEIDVAKVVAELEGVDSTDLSPVYDTIDHLVETLFADPPVSDAQAVLTFTYEGYRIHLNQDGHATFMKIAQSE